MAWKSAKKHGIGIAAVVSGVTAITMYDVYSKETELTVAVDTQIGSAAIGRAFNKEVFKNETNPATSVAEAIGRTLNNMGRDFDDTRRAAGAACLVAEMNDIDVKTGLDLYRHALEDNADAMVTATAFATAERSCEDALFNSKKLAFIIPAGVVEAALPVQPIPTPILIESTK